MANLGNTIINGVLRVNGEIIAPTFKGNVTGNASTATTATNANNVQFTPTNPTASTNYKIPFTTAAQTQYEKLRMSNAIEVYVLEGTTSALGHGMLKLGNQIASGTAQNKEGIIRLYTNNTGYVDLKVTGATANNIISFPAATGTVALTSSNVASATKLATARNINGVAFDGTANITVVDSTKLPLAGGTMTGKINHSLTSTWQTGFQGSALINSTAVASGMVPFLRKKSTNGAFLFFGYNDYAGIAYQDETTYNSSNGVKYSLGLFEDGSVRPYISEVQDLGASGKKWKDVYAIRFNGALVGNADTSTTATTATTANNIKIAGLNPTSGTWYYPIWATGSASSVPTYANDGFKYYSLQGTTSAVGQSILQAGNTTASGTAGNKQGYVRIYSSSSGYTQLTPTASTSNFTQTLPAASGTVALTSSTVEKANQLTTARTIGVSGVTGTAQSFNGTANITIPITAVPASLLTGKSAIKGSEITNDKNWVPSSDASIVNMVTMTSEEYATNGSSLTTGTIVVLSDGVEGYVSTLPTALTCDLPLGL